MVDVREKPLVSPANVIAVSPSQVPAVVTAPARPMVFERQEQFSDLMEVRGQAPHPMKIRNALFDVGGSWGIVLGGVAAALGVPLELAGLVTTSGALAVAGFFLASGFVIGGMFSKELPSPLALVAGWNHLYASDLAFLGDMREASLVDQAVVGILAERWVARIDKQRVHGEEAYAILEGLIAKRRTLDLDVIKRARSLVELYDSTVHPEHGWNLRNLTADQAKRIVAAVEALDPADKPSCGAELKKRFFKGEVERYDIATHQAARNLYRALRDAERGVSTTSPEVGAA